MYSSLPFDGGRMSEETNKPVQKEMKDGVYL